MTKQFEDYFSELQADMVAISLEYVESQADTIFIYCSAELGAYYFNVFYRINHSILHKHELNLKDENIYDTSIDRQKTLLKIGRNNLKQIHEVCKQFNHDMPTEMKLQYDVRNNSLKGKYKYELVYSYHETLLPNDIFNQWFEEVQNEIND